MTHECSFGRLLYCTRHPRWRVVTLNWRDGETRFAVIGPPDHVIGRFGTLIEAHDVARDRQVGAVQVGAA